MPMQTTIQPKNFQLVLTEFRKQPHQFRSEITKEEATIWLYDVIGEDSWGGVAAKTFNQELAKITAPVIHLKINSPGGDVFEARAMVTALREHPARIIAHIDGLAASAASYVALAADQVLMSEGSFMMIHNAWAMVIGNRYDLLDKAETLEKIDNSIASDYCLKTNQDPTLIRHWMDEETWFSAEEAKVVGLVDEISGPKIDSDPLVAEIVQQQRQNYEASLRRLVARFI